MGFRTPTIFDDPSVDELFECAVVGGSASSQKGPSK
jgi:hypothetical protein